MKKGILFFSIALISQSCTFNGTLQGIFGYQKKSTSDAPEIFNKNSDLSINCEKTEETNYKVEITNGLELKKCLSKYPKAVVYIWHPKCQSKICYPLEIVQQECDAKGIELFIVSEYFDITLMKKNYKLKRNIFAIDTKYYKSIRTKKYLEKFISDIAGKRDNYNNFIYYEKGINTRNFLEIVDF